ncbi:hypothetical protein GCM10009535_11030 [Streptomyces thermocarboxydovorans]|uniref:Cupin 2 conserved barrel domain-containing protein n=1 Tax=Streptomyces thermocarboxydovorans TaxID=59298 RepID=A0ABN1HBB0_9ACTN
MALGVPFAALVEPPVSAVQVIRAGEGPTVHSEQSSYLATLLSASPPGARRDIYAVTLEPGTVRDSDPHLPGTVEHLVVGAGRVKAGPAGESVELGPGDYMACRGDVPHTYEALEPGTRCVLIMQHV